jgi:nitrite reductase (NO-forming)
MVYVGVGGKIDGVINPTLKVPHNAVVQIWLINDDGAEHDISIPEFNALSDPVTGKGSSSAIVSRAAKDGTFAYFCTLPGHHHVGMEGKIEVGAGVEETATPAGKDIAPNATDIPTTESPVLNPHP